MDRKNKLEIMQNFNRGVVYYLFEYQKMAIILSQLYKLLNKTLIPLLLVFINNQSFANTHSYCNLNLVVSYNIEECANFFEEKISSLSLEQKQSFQKDFEKIKKDYPYPEFFIPLLRNYPTPEVLFTNLQLSEEDDKKKEYNKTKISSDEVGSLVFNEYIRIFQIYKIIIIMLEKNSNLTLSEQNMLQVSKQRSQCLGDILDDLSNNPEKSIEEKVIVDKCYK